MTLLEVRDLRVARGGRTLIDGLSFGLEEGTLLTITGANGSGKTSLLRVLAGLSPPSSGTVAWHSSRAEILYLGHASALKDELSAEENLRFALELGAVGMANAALRTALTRAGLAGARELATKRLSQGQRRRVHLARLLLSPQRFWLLDEPSTALDTEALALLAAIIDEHLAGSGIAVIATHDNLKLHAPKHVSMHLQ